MGSFDEAVMVTGASGFLGSHLCRRLGENGARVHGVSRSARPKTDSVQWWQGNVADIASARELFRKIKPDLAFHLSGLATAKPDREMILPTLHSLLISTVNLLTAAAEYGCRRVILAASLTEPQGSGAEITPGSPYAAAKWASSAYGRMFYRLYGLPVAIVRPFMTYGPGQHEEKLIPHVIRSLLAGKPPKLSSGEQQIDWIYIEDVIDGFLAAATAPDIEGHTVDLGSGALVSIRTVAERLVDFLDSRAKPLYGALPDRPLEPVRIADVNDAYRRLRWRPRTSLDEGLKQTIAWYRGRQEATSADAQTSVTQGG